MIKKIEKEIIKLNQQYNAKLEKRKQLDDEINELNMTLKELNSLKTQYVKLESGTKDFLSKL